MDGVKSQLEQEGEGNHVLLNKKLEHLEGERKELISQIPKMSNKDFRQVVSFVTEIDKREGCDTYLSEKWDPVNRDKIGIYNETKNFEGLYKKFYYIEF